MQFSEGTIGVLLIVAILASIGAGVAGVMAVQGERRVRAIYSRFARGRKEDVVTLLELHLEEIARLRAEVKRQQQYTQQVRALVGRTVSRIGTVRYDAFDDMGGRLSFSMALLDEHGDGTVITAMNGRAQTRTYAKPVLSASSSHNLSEEEVQAIAQAMKGPRRKAADVAQVVAEAAGPDAVGPGAAPEDGTAHGAIAASVGEPTP